MRGREAEKDNKPYRRQPVFLLLLFLLLVFGCARDSGDQEAKSENLVLATINNEKILAGIFKRELKIMKRKHRLHSQDVFKPEELLWMKTSVMNQLTLDSLFRQEAAKHGITVSPEEYKQALDRVKDDYQEDSYQQVFKIEDINQKDWEDKLRDSLLIKKLINTVVNSKVTVSDAELREYYEKYPREFQSPPRVKALHIMVASEDDARDIRKRLEAAPAKFGELAMKHSLGPEASRGGDLGYFQAGHMPAEFDGIFNLPIGKMSDVLRTPYGFHLFRVEDKKGEQQMSFEEAREQIRTKMLRQRQEEAFQAWSRKVKDQAQIVINYEVFSQIS